MNKLVSILLVLGTLGLAASTVFYYTVAQNETIRKDSFQRQLANAQKENQRLKNTFKTLEEYRNELEAELKNSEQAFQAMSEELGDIKKNIQDQASKKEAQINELKNHVSRSQERARSLEKKIAEKETDITSIKGKLENIALSVRQESENKIASLENQVETLTEDKNTSSLGTVTIKSK